MERKLDRIKEFDENSRRYSAIRGIEDATLRSYTWSCNTWNDQGVEGACVGFAWSHELAASPVIIRTNNESARKIYLRARQLDQWPGEDYDGTSVLAGAKAVKELVNTQGRSVMPEYRWAFGIEDVLKVLSRKGPLVFGLNWYEGMFNTDSAGFIRVTGELMGGHAILGRGFRFVKKNIAGPDTYSNVDKHRSYVTLRNSWNRDWGVNGDCRITVSDLERLLREQGEACIPIVRQA